MTQPDQNSSGHDPFQMEYVVHDLRQGVLVLEVSSDLIASQMGLGMEGDKVIALLDAATSHLERVISQVDGMVDFWRRCARANRSSKEDVRGGAAA
jgi:hypothetical protein